MEQNYPLTKQQEGLWVEWRLHPDNTSYNTCVKLRLTGHLDKERFEQALRDVVSFFNSLRVYFVEEQGLPYQRVMEDSSFDLEYEDYSVQGKSEETPEQKEKAEEFLARKLRTPVDLKTFPIIRAGLAKTTEDTHYFIGLVPHMISDGVSAVLFLEATSIAYNQGYAGLEEAYGEDTKSWADYFEEERLNQEKWDEDANYWHERLSGAQHLVDFSYGAQEQDNDIKTGKRVYFDLPIELSERLKSYSRAHRTTLFSTLVAAFSSLVHRYYAQDDILIGYPVNIRPAGYKNFFGFFVNIIPIRIDLSGDPTFDELVQRVSKSRKADKPHQTFPALDIVREIRKNLPGFDGRVFNVSMAQTVSRLVNLRLDGIDSKPLEAEYNDVNDDLSLSYELLEDGRIGLWLEYRQSLFNADFINQMIGHMQSLLAQTIDNPELPLSEYSLLDDVDTKTFLEEWAYPDKPCEPSSHDTIQAMIESRVQTNPDTVALVYQDQEITYAQMNERANQLARHIQQQGVNPGEKIALCSRRGPDLVISLLAILKAGCAYVPIAPCYPQERTEFILQDADIKLVITQKDIEKKFSTKTVYVDEIATELATYDTDNLNIPRKPADDAYIIYTSGSTGNPKGVLLTHENVVPRLNWLQSEMPLDESDIVLQNTDFSFDVSVAEIFWPLTTGARLILTEAAHYKDPSYIIDLIQNHQITTSCFVPSLLTSLLAVLKGKLTSFKYVLAAGEALSPTLVKIYHEKCSGKIYNVYGPTEGTIYASFIECKRGSDLSTIPIGRPLGETTLYILDQHNRPQPLGVAGELHIGGIGVAQGYVNRDDLTEEKFIADPFFPDQKLYKTGDLTRFLPDGNIEYLGRADMQVKVRGFRIELSEIETVISSFDGIEDVAVVDYQGDTDHKRLVAYYVSDVEVSHDALKNHIEDKLPSYMMPAFYVQIETVPRMSSGKINRRALPDPSNLFEKREAYVAPKNEVQKKLAGIWSKILKVGASKIGIHDSFFEMGGDSLMAIQFVCAAEEEGIAFETDTLFTNKTIAELAANARESGDSDYAQDLISGTYPLLPRQAKFFADNYAKPAHWNRFFYFDVNHELNLDHLKQAIDLVLLHHDNMRVSFIQDEQGMWQQKCDAASPAQEYVTSYDVSDLNEREQEEKIVETCNHCHASLDLKKPPLMRVLHFKTAHGAGKIAVIAHHLLLDIVSSRIIFEDLLKSYESLRLGISAPLSAKTSSVMEWASQLRDKAQSDDFTEELAYWSSEKMQISAAIQPDYPGVSKGYERNALVEKITLDDETTQKLLKDIPSQLKTNIQDILLTALLQTTKSWSGDDELLINICGHGRNGEQGYNLSRTAGWLNTVFPIYLSHKGIDEKDAKNLLKQVGEQQNKVPQKNEHYNLLRYITKHPDILAHEPPQLFFNYVSQIDALIPEGLSISPILQPSEIKSSHDDNHLSYLLYIEAGIIEKELNIHITYTTDIFKENTVQKFVSLYKQQIQMLTSSLNQEKEVILVS